MQRAPCCWSLSSENGSYSSFQSSIRSSTGRRVGPSRAYFKKPFESAIANPRPLPLAPCRSPGLSMGDHILLRLLFEGRRFPLRQHSLIVDRHNLHELGHHGFPIVQHKFGFAAAGVLQVCLDERPYDLLIFAYAHLFQFDHAHITALLELAILIQDVRHTARHAGSKIPAGSAEHHHDPARHVFTSMIAGAFDDGSYPAISYCKAFARRAVEITLSRCRAVE